MYYETICLSNLIGAEFHEREINGKMEECISIPIASNGLTYGRNKAVILRLLCCDKRPNWDNVSHYVSVYIPDKALKSKIAELGYEKNFKFIGTMKPSFLNNYRNNHRKYTKASSVVSLDEALDKDAPHHYDYEVDTIRKNKKNLY